MKAPGGRGLYNVQRQRTIALVQELKSRGLDIPDELLEGTKHKLVWPVSENGYFSSYVGSALYNPSETQKAFIDSTAVFSAYMGGRGSGKTAAGGQKSLHKIMLGESGAVLNPDFENFRISTWPELRKWIPWNLVVAKHMYRKEETWQPLQPFRLVFRNGASMICKGLKDPDSARGPNINWLWYDEPARDKDGLSWQIALASVRIGKDPQAWITGTPGGIDHWIYRFFVEQKIPDDAKEAFEKVKQNRKLIELFSGSIFDNQNNLNPVFMASMLATYPTGYLRKQEIFGEFVNPGGSLGDRSWFEDKYLDAPPENVKIRVRYWDMAATEKKMVGKKELNDPDESVGTLMSYTYDGKFVIEDQVCAFVEWEALLNLIKDTAIKDGPSVKLVIEQEPASGGKNQVAAVAKYIKEQIPGFPVPPLDQFGWRPDQDRVILANIWFGEAARGNVYIVNGRWVEPFLSQLDSFPDVRHDDKITSVTGARIQVAPLLLWKDIPFISL